MSISSFLEDFGALARGDVVEMTDVLLEEERLEAFEKGYQAGWDDSAKATSAETGQVSREFAEAIAEMSLTYEEAFRGLLKGVHPLLNQIVCKVLPQLFHRTLAPQLAEIIMRQLAETGPQPVVVSVAPGHAATLQDIDLPQGAPPVSIEERADLEPDKVLLRFGDRTEQEMDLNTTITQIMETIESFLETSQDSEQRKIA